MIEAILSFIKNFHLLHGILMVVLGIVFIWKWAKQGFWVPKYVHWIAAVSSAVGLGLFIVRATQQDSIKVIDAIIFIFVFPAIVYFFFVFLGGADASKKSRSSKLGKINE